MTIRIALWPGWARFVMFTGLCAAALTLFAAFGLIEGTGPRTALVIGAISAAVGALGALRGQRSHRDYTAALDGLSPADRSAAITATQRGPLPRSPAVRSATTRVGEIYLAAMARSWSVIVVTTPILIVMFTVVAVAQAQVGEAAAAVPFGALAVLLAVGTGWCWYMPRLVRRRLDMLL